MTNEEINKLWLENSVNSWKEKCKTRQEYNKKIVEIISKFIDEYPDIRFGQMLFILGILNKDKNGINDPFYEEPIDMFKRINKEK